MRLGKRLYSLVMFLVVSVLGGLLVAGLAVPLAAGVLRVGRHRRSEGSGQNIVWGSRQQAGRYDPEGPASEHRRA